MSYDGEFGSGAARVAVKGLNRTIRAMGKAGTDAEDMRQLMHTLGMIVVRTANVPVLSGRLLGTLRAGRGKTKAVVRIGGARAPYAGVRHYGYPENPSEPFLVTALRQERTNIFDTLQRGLDEILRKNNLK